MTEHVRRGRVSVTLNAPHRAHVRRTFVTLGLERGGTSAIAGAQRALGVDMGQVTEKNNEDYRFHEQPIEALVDLVERRNRESDCWGFKYPTAGSFLLLVEPHLRRPHYIIVHRDPVATTLSRERWDGEETARPALLALHEAGTRAFANMTFALASHHPCLLISHAAAMRAPDALIDELCEFLAVGTPDDQQRLALRNYLTPGLYKSFEDYFPARGDAVVTG